MLRRILTASTLLILGILLVEGVQLWRVHLAKLKAQQPTNVETASLEKSLVEAQNARRDERWERALQAYQEAMAQDPVNPDARKGIREVKSEIDMKQLVERARQRVEVGQDEEGVETYLQIVPASIYYPRARAEVHRLADLLKRRYDEECRESQRDGDIQGILSNCSHFLNLVCNNVLDEARLKAVRAAEQKLGSKNKNPPWSCPPVYARWFSEDAIADNNTLGQRIGVKYKKPQLAKVVKLYADGSVRQALNSLAQLQLNSAFAHDPEVERLKRDIALSYGAYNDGVSALGAGDWRTAQRQWDTFLELDKQILPTSDESANAVAAKGQLAKQYYKMGHEFAGQGRLADAYRDYEAGLRINKDDNDLLQGFIDLEHRAADLTTDRASCADLATALKITRPGSLNNEKAQKLMKVHQCKS